MQSFKFRCGPQVRRDSLPISQLTFTSLLDHFHELFGYPVAHHRVRYRDDCEELVELSSDRELREALRLSNNKLLELYFGTHIDHPRPDVNAKHHIILPTAIGHNVTGARQHVARTVHFASPLSTNASSSQAMTFHSPQSPCTQSGSPDIQPPASPLSLERFFRPDAACNTNLTTRAYYRCTRCEDFNLCIQCYGSSSLRTHCGHLLKMLVPYAARYRDLAPTRDSTVNQEAGWYRPALLAPMTVRCGRSVSEHDCGGDTAASQNEPVILSTPAQAIILSREELAKRLRGKDAREKEQIVRSLLLGQAET